MKRNMPHGKRQIRLMSSPFKINGERNYRAGVAPESGGVHMNYARKDAAVSRVPHDHNTPTEQLRQFAEAYPFSNHLAFKLTGSQR